MILGLRYLVERKDQEGSSPAGFHDDGHKLGVDGTEGAVPGDPGHPDVIVALVVLDRLAKDVSELTDPDAPLHVWGGRRGGSSVR